MNPHFYKGSVGTSRSGNAKLTGYFDYINCIFCTTFLKGVYGNPLTVWVDIKKKKAKKNTKFVLIRREQPECLTELLFFVVLRPVGTVFTVFMFQILKQYIYNKLCTSPSRIRAGLDTGA